MVADEPGVPRDYVNVRVSARYLDLEDQGLEVKGDALGWAHRYPAYAYGDELHIEGRLETPPEFEDFSYR